MQFNEYMLRRDALLREFAKIYNPGGPEGGHNLPETRNASAALTELARSIQPEWFPPIRKT